MIVTKTQTTYTLEELSKPDTFFVSLLRTTLRDTTDPRVRARCQQALRGTAKLGIDRTVRIDSWEDLGFVLKQPKEKEDGGE